MFLQYAIWGVWLPYLANYLIQNFSTMRHVPIAFLTAKDGRNIRKVINLAPILIDIRFEPTVFFSRPALSVDAARIDAGQSAGADPPCTRLVKIQLTGAF